MTLLPLIAGLAAMAGAEPLTGNWAVFGARLSLTHEGGMLQQECSATRIGPVRLDRQGRFKVEGQVETGAGPQPADQPAKLQPVRVSGAVQGDTLRLVLARKGAPPETLVLQRNSRAKVIRCL